MIKALDELWRYTGELFVPADYEIESGIDFSGVKETWLKNVKNIFDEAVLSIPGNVFMQLGGKNGIHTEQFGHILAELQYVQRAYPNSEW